jgi:hypothetical protein
MGQIVKQLGETTTKYYWYPGDTREYRRSFVAASAGVGAFCLVYAVSRSVLAATTIGASATALLAGLNFGRRDADALVDFPDVDGRAARRAAVVHTRRAVWRAIVEGAGAACAAILIANLTAGGFVANWVLPVVPAAIGACAHQAGMLLRRMEKQVSTAQTHAGRRNIASARGVAVPPRS